MVHACLLSGIRCKLKVRMKWFLPHVLTLVFVLTMCATVHVNTFAVKPATTEKLRLRAGSDMQLELHWDHPVGRIPGDCLEWEVEHKQEGPDGKTASVWIS